MPHPIVERRTPSAATTLHQQKQRDRPSRPPAIATTTTTATVAPQHGTGTGCLLCGTNDNEDKILLCEHCDGEYHTYCVSLKEIPEGEWYCDNCSSEMMDTTNIGDDGLDQQVAALPPSITSRYGEIVWAHGGAFYGWWPAIIYDPRQTVEPARSQARKHLRSKHLCYFYQCAECPFSILPEKKIKDWLEGLSEDFHLGRAAKSHGKQRFRSFQQAMEVACLELEKTVHERLDWEHTTTSKTITASTDPAAPQLLSPAAMVAKTIQRQQQRNRVMSRTSTPDSATAAMDLPADRSANSASSFHQQGSSVYGKISSKRTTDFNQRSRLKKPAAKPEKSQKRKRRRSRSEGEQEGRPDSPREGAVVPIDSELVCKIKFLHQAPQQPGDLEGARDVGFVLLKSRQTSTFQDARTAIEDALVSDVLPAELQWRFHVPRLGPVSLKQEATLRLIQFAGNQPDADDGNTDFFQKPLILYVQKKE